MALNADHRPTAEYIHDLRMQLPAKFPGVMFSFLPADIVTQILNFGLPAPIDIQVIGRNLEANRTFAGEPAASAWRRSRASSTCACTRRSTSRGCTSTSTARAPRSSGSPSATSRTTCSISLSGSGQTTPTFWLNPTTGVSYPVATQTPQYRIELAAGSRQHPGRRAADGTHSQMLEGLASITRGAGPLVVSHYNISPVIDIYGGVQGRDLGSVSREIAPILAASQKDLPRGSQITVRGQIETMNSSFVGLLGAWRSPSCSSTC